MFRYIYLYVYIYMYMYLHLYIYVYVCIRICICNTLAQQSFFIVIWVQFSKSSSEQKSSNFLLTKHVFVCMCMYVCVCVRWHIIGTNIHIRMCICICICICVYICESNILALQSYYIRSWVIIIIKLSTGWRRLIGCLKLQVIFRKKATNYRALLRKITYKDEASYDATPPCIELTFENFYQLKHRKKSKKKLLQVKFSTACFSIPRKSQS